MLRRLITEERSAEGDADLGGWALGAGEVPEAAEGRLEQPGAELADEHADRLLGDGGAARAEAVVAQGLRLHDLLVEQLAHEAPVAGARGDDDPTQVVDDVRIGPKHRVDRGVAPADDLVHRAVERYGREALAEEGDDRVLDGLLQPVLAAEVVPDETGGDPGGAGDLAQARRGDAPLGEERQRRVPDAGAGVTGGACT